VTKPSDSQRISFELPADVARRLDAHIDWGLKSAVFCRLSTMLADLLDRRGKVALGYILADSISFKLKDEKGEVIDDGDAE